MREMVAERRGRGIGPERHDGRRSGRPVPETGSVEVPTEARSSALSVPWFVPLWLSGALWNIARWGTSFISAYLVNQMTGSPRLVQLTGVAMWSPLLLGGVVGGMISDRFDRRRMVLGQFFVVIPCAFLLGFAEIGGRMHLWLVYPFLVMVGSGWVLDMTSRRAMVYDLVGPGRIDNAMGLESVSSAVGLALGTLLGGTIVEAIGEGAAFLGVGLLMCASFALLWSVPRRTCCAPARRRRHQRPAARRAPAGVRPAAQPPGAGQRARRHRLRELLLLQLHAAGADHRQGPRRRPGSGRRAGVDGRVRDGDRVDVRGPLPAGAPRPRLRGRFVRVHDPADRRSALALVRGQRRVLLAASVGTGLFGSTQSTLVMTAVPAEVRGRALGLLSTAIGMLPLGMLALGEVAQRVGAPAAIVSSMLIGLVCMVVWQFAMPEARRLRA